MGMEVSAEILRQALDDPDARAATSLTRMQADAILAMRLQQLTGLEADKLGAEYRGLKPDIAEYERILGDEQVILDLIRAGRARTQGEVRQPRGGASIDLEELGDYDKEALIREEVAWSSPSPTTATSNASRPAPIAPRTEAAGGSPRRTPRKATSSSGCSSP